MLTLPSRFFKQYFKRIKLVATFHSIEERIVLSCRKSSRDDETHITSNRCFFFQCLQADDIAGIMEYVLSAPVHVQVSASFFMGLLV